MPDQDVAEANARGFVGLPRMFAARALETLAFGTSCRALGVTRGVGVGGDGRARGAAEAAHEPHEQRKELLARHACEHTLALGFDQGFDEAGSHHFSAFARAFSPTCATRPRGAPCRAGRA